MIPHLPLPVITAACGAAGNAGRSQGRPSAARAGQQVSAAGMCCGTAVPARSRLRRRAAADKAEPLEQARLCAGPTKTWGHN